MVLQLVATAAFGLEKVVVRELADLGYEGRVERPGRIAFAGDAGAVCRANLWLRSADRVLIQLAHFPATDFDALFDTVREIPWEDWAPPDGAIPVTGRSQKSQLASVPACQRTVKKAIVERLTQRIGGATIPETGPPLPVDVTLFEDRASISVDTSGRGLHRRGYRKLAGTAQLRETLAAGLVQLSFWQPERQLIDPFCGTGTIAIEAALWGRRLAPGKSREFAAEHWPSIPAEQWKQARVEVAETAHPALPLRIIATDIDANALQLARYHAEQAGVGADIHFQQRDFRELSSARQYGCMICNPPYGQRMGDDRQIESLYRAMPQVLRRLKTWSHFILTARGDFESLVGQPADRRRKLYNGRIACTYYQFHGPRVPGTTATVHASSHSGDEPSPGVVAQAFGGMPNDATRQAEEFANRLRKRARHLRRWPTRRGIDCYRLFDRDIPEIPLVVDRYADALHVAEFERPHARTAAQHADWLDHLLQVAADTLEVSRDAVFIKQRTRQRGAAQYERVAKQNITRVVTENGLRFRVNLSDYLDTGLFLDHRITRGLVRDKAREARVLNLFAYTGSFTVYAAAGEAAHTVSVDTSATYLDWARDNLQLNEVDGPEHELVRCDAMKFLRELPQSTMFDVMVIDPPTFSNRKGQANDWDIQRDHVGLLQRAIAHLDPRGTIFFSTNSRRFKLADGALPDVACRDISPRTIPEDFRNQRVHKCWQIRPKRA